jgi:2-polyprenyl-6-methoxyphenol hydroxylase-like FAD-dependent oxidoreductase
MFPLLKTTNKQVMHKAIIIGAGVAGPILAIQLKDLGYDVEIFEARREEEMSEGLFLGFTPNGQNVLKHFVPLDELYKDYTTGSMQFYNQENRLIASLDNTFQKEKYGAETIQIKRSHLNHLAIKAATERGIAVNYGKKCVGIQETEENVTILFEDGSQATADLVFGADGTFSAVRNILFPGANKPVYMGNISTGGYASLPHMRWPLHAIQMIFGERAFFAYNVTNNGEIWWFNNYYRKQEPAKGELQSIMKNEILQDLLRIHKNDPPIITEILKASHELIAYPVYDIPSLKQWHTKRVCLLGDAAHAIAPHSGQGASLALEDTVCIANALLSATTPFEAFQLYQGQRQQRVEKIIKTTRKIGSQKSKPNRLATWFRDQLLGFFIKQTIKQIDWIYIYQIAPAKQLMITSRKRTGKDILKKEIRDSRKPLKSP